jgi:hypothetical protein
MLIPIQSDVVASIIRISDEDLELIVSNIAIIERDMCSKLFDDRGYTISLVGLIGRVLLASCICVFFRSGSVGTLLLSQ